MSKRRPEDFDAPPQDNPPTMVAAYLFDVFPVSPKIACNDGCKLLFSEALAKLDRSPCNIFSFEQSYHII